MSETTPLLAADKPASIGRFFSPYRRVLVATFILSNAFFFVSPTSSQASPSPPPRQKAKDLTSGLLLLLDFVRSKLAHHFVR
jgi:hypothetical protein